MQVTDGQRIRLELVLLAVPRQDHVLTRLQRESPGGIRGRIFAGNPRPLVSRGNARVARSRMVSDDVGDFVGQYGGQI